MDLRHKEHAVELFLLSLLSLTTVSALLVVGRVLLTGSLRYTFLLWNLFLAWLPLLFIWLAKYASTRKRKYAWTFLWALFLPNCFYIVTDFIHIKDSGKISLVYDAVTIMACASIGVILGLCSIDLARRSYKKLSGTKGLLRIYGLLFVCGFAIYLGRVLRWNSWDVFLNPFGLIVDVSDRVIDPSSHPQTLLVTTIFSLFLCSIYTVWVATRRLIMFEQKK